MRGISLKPVSAFINRALNNLNEGWYKTKNWFSRLFNKNSQPIDVKKQQAVKTQESFTFLQHAYQYGDSKTLLWIADAYLSLSLDKLAISFLKKAMAIFPQEPRLSEITLRDRLYYRFGQYYEGKFEEKKAIYWYSKLDKKESAYYDLAKMALGNIYLAKAIDNSPTFDTLYSKQYQQKATKYFWDAAIEGSDDAEKLYYYTQHGIEGELKYQEAQEKLRKDNQFIEKEKKSKRLQRITTLRDRIETTLEAINNQSHSLKNSIITIHKEFIAMLPQQNADNELTIIEDNKSQEREEIITQPLNQAPIQDKESLKTQMNIFKKRYQEGEKNIISLIDNHFESLLVKATQSDFYNKVEALLNRYQSAFYSFENYNRRKNNPKCEDAIDKTLSDLKCALKNAKEAKYDEPLAKFLLKIKQLPANTGCSLSGLYWIKNGSDIFKFYNFRQNLNAILKEYNDGTLAGNRIKGENNPHVIEIKKQYKALKKELAKLGATAQQTHNEIVTPLLEKLTKTQQELELFKKEEIYIILDKEKQGLQQELREVKQENSELKVKITNVENELVTQKQNFEQKFKQERQERASEKQSFQQELVSQKQNFQQELVTQKQNFEQKFIQERQERFIEKNTLKEDFLKKIKKQKEKVMDIDEKYKQQEQRVEFLINIMLQQTIPHNEMTSNQPLIQEISKKPESHDTWICPITQLIMEDPVIAEDGHSYERIAIMQWLELKNISPITRQTISDKLITNYALKNSIDEYHENCKKWEVEQNSIQRSSVGSLPTFFNHTYSSSRMDNQSTSSQQASTNNRRF
ncbi:MAG: hypothetical protein LEGION0398_MBIBDBAK_00104 [Legionellaceae bacterium]